MDKLKSLVEQVNRRHVDCNYSLVYHGNGRYTLKRQNSRLVINKPEVSITNFLTSKISS